MSDFNTNQLKISQNIYIFFKAIMDFFVALIGLIVLIPLFIIVAIAIKIDSKGPVFFVQKRIGKDGKLFNCVKFRSMAVEARPDVAGYEYAEVKSYITKVGAFLRKTSIDELPQLFNVLLGDMSLVGPRPPLPSEVRTYTLEDRKRLNITPGITCLWQVSGRSELPFSKQIALDKEYIASQSAWKDFLILLKTIPAILTGKGAW